MTVTFWTFAKKANSTARPSAAAAASFDCKLKDASGVLHPILQLANTGAAQWNPSAYNYAYIASYGRYYFVQNWEWANGLWECTLSVDVLATYKTTLTNSVKYVLRASADWDNRIVDDMYPCLYDYDLYEAHSYFSGWTAPSMTGLRYIIGIINNQYQQDMPISYYALDPSTVGLIREHLYITSSRSWDAGFDSIPDVLTKAVANPQQYISGLRWFPFVIPSSSYDTADELVFGQFYLSNTTHIYGYPIATPSNWSSFTQRISLPTGWGSSVAAKYQSAPYCAVYVKCNPWGVIEINPADLADSDKIKLVAYPDLVSGSCRLEVYAEKNGVEQHLLHQSVAQLAVDIPLEAPNSDLSGFINSIAGTVGGIARVAASGSVGTAVASGIESIGSVVSAGGSLAPSISTSGGNSYGLLNADGEASLYIRIPSFAQESLAELGRPLYQNRRLGSLVSPTYGNYIKCADAEIEISGYEDEITELGEYLTGGFYFE